jgi:hypothetical protein
MTRIRLVLGLFAGGVGIFAVLDGLRALVDTVRGAMAVRAPDLILPGLVGPVILFAVASILLRLAYRNLFWRRYVAGLRRTPASVATTPPHKH